MTSKSDDVDDIDILNKIAVIKEELANLSERTVDISMQEKMLRHRLYDLEYELKQK